MKTFSRAALLATVLACAGAHAADFTVTPVRIFMTPRDRAVALTITNDSAEEIVMQADLYSWKQKADGTDDLQVTEDLVLSPPILKVPANSRQVVRLARIGAAPAGQELTYRIFVREIPEARTPAQNQLGVQLSLAFSLPIFVTPPGAKRNLDCKLARSAPDTVVATCQNTGTAYAQVRSLEVSDDAGKAVVTREAGGYVLPGISRSFEMKSGQRIAGGAFKLQVGFDDGTSQAFPAVVAN